MEITDIRIRKLSEDSKMRAIVSVTFDDELVIHDIKIIESTDKVFLAMPSRRLLNGTYSDTKPRVIDNILLRYCDEINLPSGDED